MKSSPVGGLSLALCLSLVGPAEAADPVDARPRPAAAAPAKPAAPEPKPAATEAVPRKPLDLRIGNFKSYMMPNEYRAALGAPDADKNTIVVEGQRVLVPMQRIEEVPPGLFGLWYAAKHPLNSWRLLAPVAHQPEVPPPDVVIPPPIFRWGP